MTNEEWENKLDELWEQANADGRNDLATLFASAHLALIEGYLPQAAYVFGDFIKHVEERRALSLKN